MNDILENNFLKEKKIGLAIAVVILIIYAGALQVNTPDFIRNLFKNDIFRFVFLSLLLIVGPTNSQPSVALIIAFVFVFTMYCISEKEVKENLTYLEAYKTISQNNSRHGSTKHSSSKHK
jgi:hypothetical protein